MNGEYVELHKLLPRGFDGAVEEDGLELTSRGGRIFYVPLWIVRLRV